MCGGPEHSKPVLKSYRMMLADDPVCRPASLPHHTEALLKPPVIWSDLGKACCGLDQGSGGAGGGGTFTLLELAASNSIEEFQRAVKEGGLDIDEPDDWYLRRIGYSKMAMEKRTPLMIAASYGSVEVLAHILATGKTDVNRLCGEDEVTALHCAAAGGSPRAVEAVKLLLSSGANKSITDAFGRRASQVISVPLKHSATRVDLEKMLVEPRRAHTSNGSPSSKAEENEVACGTYVADGFISVSSMSSSVCSSPDSYSPVFSPQYPSSPKSGDTPGDGGDKKEYPVDPSLPDIKNSIYTTDEFRMFSFKIRPCSRAYSHDWTECPFVHPGENARRRDPRRYHYSCVPCPDFRKGACRRGDSCEYAHGVFECWLHPAQYRTRLCKDGTSCARRVCFFAHTSEEMRPLYVSMGSAVPSPRSSSPLDAGSASPPPSGASQSPVLLVPPFSPSNASGSGLSTPPLSPSASSLGGSWSQPTVPTLHLPGGAGLQTSRLRAALSARDIPVEDFSRGSDYDLAAEFSSLSTLSRQNSLLGAGSSSGRMHKFSNLGLSIPTQDLFSTEVSPLHQEQQSIITQHQHQLQLQQLLSPLSQLQGHVSPQFQSPGQSIFSSAGSPSSRRSDMSSETPGAVDVLAARKAAFGLREKTGSLTSPSPSTSWSDWGSPTGKPDWGHDLSKFRRSSSFATHTGGAGSEPDVSWVQSLVKDGPAEVEASSSSPDQHQIEEHCFTGDWSEQRSNKLA